MTPHTLPLLPARRLVASILVVLSLVAASLLAASPASAAPGGSVSGTVLVEMPQEVGEPTFGPSTNTWVGFYPLWGNGDVITGSWTDSSGNYTVSGLEQGPYRLLFESQDTTLSRVWWDSPYEVGSTVLEVGADDITGVNTTLVHGTSISGHVSIGGSTATVAAAAAFLWNPSTGEFERYSFRATTDSNGDYTITGLAAGSYLLRFGSVYDDFLVSTEYWSSADYIFQSDELIVTDDAPVTGKDGSLTGGGIYLGRLAGADRFGTAVDISQEGFDSGTPFVFIVSGRNFPDALSAGPAASALGAPVLLVEPTSIPSVVAAELDRLAPSVIFIIGGPVSVSASVKSQLGSYADEVVRISGADRYETSRAVAEEFFDGADNRTAYLATGSNFPDALGAGPAAANEYGPVILMNGGATSVDSPTSALLQQLGISKVVIAGGPNSFSTSLEQSLRAKPYLDEVYRRSGENRYDTAVKVNENSFRVADTVFLATGSSFPDALAGAALAGHPIWHAPVFLVQANCIPVDVLNQIAYLQPRDIYLLGGTAVLGAGVENFVPCP